MKLTQLLLQVLGLLIACDPSFSAMAAENGSVERDLNLTADQILERVKAASKDRPSEEQAFKYLRRATILDLKSDGSVREKTEKIYRAFTDGQDQDLLEINGKPASDRDRAKDRAHNLERQQKFLHRQTKKDTGKNEDDLMAKNMEMFREKFTANLKGEESRKDRTAYLIELIPNEHHQLKNHFVDRLMNQIRAKVWVDKEEFHIVGLEMKLVNQVSFLGGFAGLLRDIRIHVDQQRLKPKLWVDEKISAFFDVRVLFKTYRFRMSSASSDFELIGRPD